jgi:3-hydroxyisobutyrate dehydrogenase-like beta-hydroxyacid dehydrogenase
MAKVERIAFLGLGIMGSRMAANLCRARFEVTAWNRSPGPAEELANAHGARAAATPAEAATGAELVITMVTDSPQVEEVLFGENGAADGLAEGALVMDMSTVAPSASRAMAERLAGQGVAFLDAPVTGSKPKAEDGTLTIMVGGEPADLDRARPALDAMGALVVHAGPTGHGSMVKLINNMVAAVNAVAVAEALRLAREADVDTDALLEVMKAGSGASTMLNLKAGPILSGDYEPLFKLEHMLKDVRHTLREAEALGVELPRAGEAERLYTRADAAGLGEQDFAAVATALPGAGP